MTRENFLRLRRAIGLSQVALAAQLGVHEMTVSRWERGTVPIPEPVAQLMTRLATEKKPKKRKR